MAKYGLVNERQFVAATRETGYRSTAAAVSELVDNALQAQARQISILMLEEREDAGREITVAVADDGHGMTPVELRRALQWAGSTRFNDRSGLGRFGMGLPNSSVSQARRVEVYSWRSGEQPHFTYLDLDEIEEGRLKTVPTPKRRSLPNWAPQSAVSGTLVVWSRCDRLDYKKASTLERKLEAELGRIFRKALWGGVQILLNGTAVPAQDPLYLHIDEETRASEPVPTLRFPVRLEGGVISEVVARFSLLPIRAWHGLPLDAKRAIGIVGGAGVSVLRAGREIAQGWYFMNGKRRQNYDDWWRLQVEFEPPLDELMGVTHSKQGIRPTSELNAILGPDLGAVARELSSRVRQEFLSLATTKAKPEAVKRAEGREWRLPRVSVEGERRGLHESGTRAKYLQYEIGFADSADAEFFSWTRTGAEVRLQINENHPFYRALYRPVAEAGLEWVKAQIDLVLLAFARAEISGEHADDPSLRARWSDVVATFLDE